MTLQRLSLLNGWNPRESTMVEEVGMKTMNGVMLGTLMSRRAERHWQLLRTEILSKMKRTCWIGINL